MLKTSQIVFIFPPGTPRRRKCITLNNRSVFTCYLLHYANTYSPIPTHVHYILCKCKQRCCSHLPTRFCHYFSQVWAGPSKFEYKQMHNSIPVASVCDNNKSPLGNFIHYLNLYSLLKVGAT